MASQYTVDSDAIAAHGADTGALVHELETSLTNLNSKLTTLQGQWRGSASTNFAGLMSTWHSDMSRMKQTLASISQALHLTSSEYSQAEDANTRRWMAA